MKDEFSKLLKTLKDKLHSIPDFYEDVEAFVMSCTDDIETAEEIIYFIEQEEPTTSELIQFCIELSPESMEYIDDSEYAEDDEGNQSEKESEED